MSAAEAKNESTRAVCRLHPGRLLRARSGSAVVETALALLMLVTACFWLFEFCMMAYSYGVISNAAQEAVRYATLHGTDSSNCSGPSSGCSDTSASNVKAVVTGYSSWITNNSSRLTTTVSYLDSSSKPPSRVKVIVNYSYQSYFNLPYLPSSISATAQGRIIF